jgi:K+-transporting ATPase ATPase A chain
MTSNGWFQIIVFFGIVLVCAKPLGVYMARVFERERTFADRIFRPVERLIYRFAGIDETHEMHWREYATLVLIFSLVSLILTYVIERLQYFLPLNPQHFAGVAPDLALNTAVSFTANTNWQSYVPETTMSYLTQMAGLASHNFLSGALGIACAIALVRGISRKESKTLGNFWVDTTRASLWVLLPAAFICSIVLVSQGVIQNFRPYDQAKLLQPQVITAAGSDGKSTTQIVTIQVIAQGPAASQESIKMLGTNGGGFFNANSAHPFENPTPFSNLVEMFAIFFIPAGLTVTLGRMVRSPAHGWAVFAAMSALSSQALWWPITPKFNPILCFIPRQCISTSAQRRCSRVAIWRAKKCGSG